MTESEFEEEFGKAFEKEFSKMLSSDAEATLQLVTGMFVGVTLEYMRRRGHDVERDVVIECLGQRSITIHKTSQD